MNIEMITTLTALQQAVPRLAGEPFLACDLEADSMHHYREQVCLLQISTPTVSLVIDPLACPDLSPLAPLFADPAIRKVFHGADYDVRSLHRDFAITITNLFDTMVASQFLGEPAFGLAAVLKKRFGVELDKRYQQADWTKRPLPAAMIDYAVKDTTLLLELYRQQEAELQARGRLAWVLEECELLTRVRMTERSDEPLVLRFKGASRLAPATLAVLEELLRYRDQEAQRRDLPQFKILGTDTMRELAERKPVSIEDLAGVPGLSSRLVERFGKGILSAVQRGKATPPEEMPRFPQKRRLERSRSQEERLKRLKEWRVAKAAEFGMEPGILANNTLLEALADGVITGPADLAKVAGLKEWQHLVLGPELLRFVQE
jgi:ribonuclease D